MLKSLVVLFVNSSCYIPSNQIAHKTGVRPVLVSTTEIVVLLWLGYTRTFEQSKSSFIYFYILHRHFPEKLEDNTYGGLLFYLEKSQTQYHTLQEILVLNSVSPLQISIQHFQFDLEFYLIYNLIYISYFFCFNLVHRIISLISLYCQSYNSKTAVNNDITSRSVC